MKKLAYGLLILLGIALWIISGVMGKTLGKSMFESVKHPATLAILCGSILLIFLLRKAETPIKRVGLLLWIVSAIIFSPLFIWHELNPHGDSLISYWWDERILFFSFLGMVAGLLLRLAVLQKIITGARNTGKRILIWIKTGS